MGPATKVVKRKKEKKAIKDVERGQINSAEVSSLSGGDQARSFRELSSRGEVAPGGTASSVLVSEQPHETGKRRKPADEIDEIFACAKKLRRAAQGTGGAAAIPAEVGRIRARDGSDHSGERTSGNGAGKTVSRKQKTEGKQQVSAGSAPKPKTKTAEGFNVYAETDLKWNRKNSGGTPLCPFDCKCCY